MRFPRGRPSWIPVKGKIAPEDRKVAKQFSEYLCGLYLDGCSTNELARYFDVSQCFVWRRIKDIRGKSDEDGRQTIARVDPGEYRDQSRQMMMEYEAEGVPQRVIAKRYGLSPAMTQRRIADARWLRRIGRQANG